MFYDVDIFLAWVDKVRARGINVPIVPGNITFSLINILTYSGTYSLLYYDRYYAGKKACD